MAYGLIAEKGVLLNAHRNGLLDEEDLHELYVPIDEALDKLGGNIIH
ncbi:hypothetical protein [Syntrophomonas palmitatica]|nr:hypothetical protein [Syntrophomonas palmitatica]